MLIKINDKIFNSKKTPIVIVLQDGDLEDLKFLKDNDYRICIFGGVLNKEDLKDIMSLDIDPKHQA